MTDPDDITGFLFVAPGRNCRFRIGHDSGDTFALDDDFDGVTLTIEASSVDDAAAMLSLLASGDMPGETAREVRAEALRHAEQLIHRVAGGYKAGGDHAIACALYLTAGNVTALLDTPAQPAPDWHPEDGPDPKCSKCGYLRDDEGGCMCGQPAPDMRDRGKQVRPKPGAPCGGYPAAPPESETAEQAARVLEASFQGQAIPDDVRDTIRTLAAEAQPAPDAVAQAAWEKMADNLIAYGAHKCVLTVDPHIGWPDGLKVPMNEPPRTEDDWSVVAHLDHEDSQYGPRLWDFAITVLKARAEGPKP